MRILVVSEDIPYPNMGGLAKHVLNLCRALVRAGHKVDLLGGDQNPISVAGEEGQFGGQFFGELNGHLAGWKEIRLGMFLPPRRTWVAKRFASIILRRAYNYDVVHYHGHVPNVARYIPADINFVQTRHDQGSDCIMNTRFRNGTICESIAPADCASCRTANPNLLQRTVSATAVKNYREEVSEGFRRHKTVFVSDMLQRNFSRSMGTDVWGRTVHHFVDLAKVKHARESVQPPSINNGIEVFVGGKLYLAKGIEIFLRALVPSLPSHMRVTVAGDGESEARLRAEFESSQIRFLGWCTPEKTLEMTARAHAVVVPSLCEEAFGATTLEGLLLGKPTFALARGGTPELAMYACAPDQLRLHLDMQSLVQDLVSMDSFPCYAPPPEGLGGAERVIEQLLQIYKLPPGRMAATANNK